MREEPEGFRAHLIERLASARVLKPRFFRARRARPVCLRSPRARPQVRSALRQVKQCRGRGEHAQTLMGHQEKSGMAPRPPMTRPLPSQPGNSQPGLKTLGTLSPMVGSVYMTSSAMASAAVSSARIELHRACRVHDIRSGAAAAGRVSAEPVAKQQSVRTRTIAAVISMDARFDLERCAGRGRRN